MTFDQALGKNKKKRKLGIGEGAFLENSPSSGRFIRQHEMKLKEKEPAGVFLSQVRISFQFLSYLILQESKFQCLMINSNTYSFNLDAKTIEISLKY